MDQQTPEEDDEPRRAAETADVAHKLWRRLSQKYTHSKARERQQGNPTCKPSRPHRNRNTLRRGVKPQLPQQSGAGEAQKFQRTCSRENSAQALRKKPQQDPSNHTEE